MSTGAGVLIVTWYAFTETTRERATVGRAEDLPRRAFLRDMHRAMVTTWPAAYR